MGKGVIFSLIIGLVIGMIIGAVFFSETDNNNYEVNKLNEDLEFCYGELDKWSMQYANLYSVENFLTAEDFESVGDTEKRITINEDYCKKGYLEKTGKTATKCVVKQVYAFANKVDDEFVMHSATPSCYCNDEDTFSYSDTFSN